MIYRFFLPNGRVIDGMPAEGPRQPQMIIWGMGGQTKAVLASRMATASVCAVADPERSPEERAHALVVAVMCAKTMHG